MLDNKDYFQNNNFKNHQKYKFKTFFKIFNIK